MEAGRNSTVTTPEPPHADAGPVFVQPFGNDGPATVAVCSCGAGPHAALDNRCARGHQWRGAASPALVTGETSTAFWREHERARAEVRADVIADAGHTVTDAPRALAITAESIAQAVLVRDSAYQRMAEAGGPLTSSGRARRCLSVWCAAMDRLERHLKLVGLERQARHLTPHERLAAAFSEERP